MTLEYIRAVKALLGRRAGAGTETANHRPLIMRQSMAVLVILSRKAFPVVVASGDWALLRALKLMSKHVRLKVLECLATVWEGAGVLGVGR